MPAGLTGRLSFFVKVIQKFTWQNYTQMLHVWNNCLHLGTNLWFSCRQIFHTWSIWDIHLVKDLCVATLNCLARTPNHRNNPYPTKKGLGALEGGGPEPIVINEVMGPL